MKELIKAIVISVLAITVILLFAHFVAYNNNVAPPSLKHYLISPIVGAAVIVIALFVWWINRLLDRLFE